MTVRAKLLKLCGSCISEIQLHPSDEKNNSSFGSLQGSKRRNRLPIVAFIFPNIKKDTTMNDSVQFEYQCVAGPTVIEIGKKENRTQAVAEYQNIINREASKGWEFVGIDEFRTSEPPGCLQGNKPIITIFKMIIFKRPKASSSASSSNT